LARIDRTWLSVADEVVRHLVAEDSPVGVGWNVQPVPGDRGGGVAVLERFEPVTVVDR
jgi:hypothetical protein